MIINTIDLYDYYGIPRNGVNGGYLTSYIRTESLLKRDINFIGNAILFSTESNGVIQCEYIDFLHAHKLLVWMNAIVYDEKDVISAGHTDDSAFYVSSEHGRGRLASRGEDNIQTDWLSAAKAYFTDNADGR